MKTLLLFLYLSNEDMPHMQSVADGIQEHPILSNSPLKFDKHYTVLTHRSVLTTFSFSESVHGTQIYKFEQWFTTRCGYKFQICKSMICEESE